MKDKSTVVVYDMDSTVAHTYWRWHLTPTQNPDSTWDDYAMACSGDTPLPGTVARMRLDWPEHQVHICTGRPEKSRELTQAWLREHVGPYWDHLELRPTGSRMPNGDFKVQYTRQLQAAGLEVVLFYEDWSKVAAQIYSETKVPVLGVNPFYVSTTEGAI